MEYKSILFDFDGVLGDTMQDNYQAWSWAFQNQGVRLERESYFFLEGLSPKKVAETILAREGMTLSLVSDIVSQKERHYWENNQFRFFPGALDLLAECRERYTLGLVSGAGAERLRRSTGGAFLDRFGAVITGDSVKHPKPAPEPYLLAAEALDVHPSRCLVVENAPMGIQAAKSAGMTCVAVCSTLAEKHLQAADAVVSDLESLRRFLRTDLSVTS